MKLYQWRKREGLTLGQAGARFGVSHVSVLRYEKGEVPRPEIMRNIIRETGGEVTANDWYVAEIGGGGPAGAAESAAA